MEAGSYCEAGYGDCHRSPLLMPWQTLKPQHQDAFRSFRVFLHSSVPCQLFVRIAVLWTQPLPSPSLATGRVNMDEATGLRIVRLWAYMGNRVWDCGFRI